MKTFILLRKQGEKAIFDPWALVRAHTIEEAKETFQGIAKSDNSNAKYGISLHQDPTGKTIIEYI